MRPSQYVQLVGTLGRFDLSCLMHDLLKVGKQKALPHTCSLQDKARDCTKLSNSCQI